MPSVSQATLTPSELAARLSPEREELYRKRLLSKVLGAVRKAARKTAPVGKEKLGTRVNRKGKTVRIRRLRDTLGTRIIERGAVGSVLTRAYIARFIGKGTAAHDIKPVNVKAMTLPLQGGAPLTKGAPLGHSLVRMVKHPGIKADPFLDRGLEQSSGEIDTVMRTVGDEFFQSVVTGIEQALGTVE